jgi:hypothetical protein
MKSVSAAANKSEKVKFVTIVKKSWPVVRNQQEIKKLVEKVAVK